MSREILHSNKAPRHHDDNFESNKRFIETVAELRIIFVKIELCERKTWCYFRNLLYLCHDDLFSFPPKQAVQSSLGDFFVSYAKIQKIYDTGNQIVKFV